MASPRQDSEESRQELVVEYSYSDTFSTLIERCLIILNIRGSSDGNSSSSTKSAQKQAIMFDQNNNMITMMQEIKAEQTYIIEVVSDDLIQFNHLAGMPQPIMKAYGYLDFKGSGKQMSSGSVPEYSPLVKPKTNSDGLSSGSFKETRGSLAFRTASDDFADRGRTLSMLQDR